jgi:YD repeat-containing protein
VQVADSLGNQSNYTSQPSGVVPHRSTRFELLELHSRRTVSQQFDINGDMLWSIDALGNTTNHQCDPQNNLSSASKPLDASNTATTLYGYNSFGEVTYFTDAAGNQTANSYDANGNSSRFRSPTSSLAQFGYDAKGELTSIGELPWITDALHNVTTLTYT